LGAPSTRQSSLRFGLFTVDLSSATLYRSGRKIALQEKPFLILAMLLDRPGELITRDDIRKQLWPEGTFVDFNEGIDTALKKLRYALGDSAQNPTFIETVPRRGYRFIASVSNGTGNVDSLTEAELPLSPVAEPAQVRSTSRRYLVAFSVILLLSLAGYGVFRIISRSPDVDVHRVQMTKLSDNGQVQTVAISPDGRYVAYARGDDVQQSLWLREVASHQEIQILPNGPGFHGLTFSPDGDSLYIVRSDVNDPFFKYLYVLPRQGGTINKLVTDIDSPVSFSPDGKQFVYERCVPPRDYIEVKIANADGTNDHLLTTIPDGSAMLYQPGPNWSPDGRNIAIPVEITSPQPHWALDMVSATDGSIREVFSGSMRKFLGRPVWFPSGKGLLFTHVDNTAGRYQLWTMSFPEGRAQPLTHDLADYGSDLDMTRDGGTFVGTSSEVVSHAWLGPASDLSQVHQVNSDPFPVTQVAEAPDGKVLVISSDNSASVMYTDGSQRTRFTDLEPVYEPATCGRFVLLRTDHEDSAIVRFDQDGSNPTILVRGGIDSPTCSADRTAVFYYTTIPPQKFWRVPLEGGPPQYVADGLGDLLGQTMDVSPDGKYLVYPYTQFGRVPSEGWKLPVIPVNGGPPIRQFTVPSESEGVRVRWSPNGKGLQYVVTEKGVSNLWEQPLSGGKPKQLTRFTSGQIFSFNWTVDRTRLLMSRGNENRNAVLLTDLAVR